VCRRPCVVPPVESPARSLSSAFHQVDKWEREGDVNPGDWQHLLQKKHALVQRAARVSATGVQNRCSSTATLSQPSGARLHFRVCQRAARSSTRLLHATPAQRSKRQLRKRALKQRCRQLLSERRHRYVRHLDRAQVAEVAAVQRAASRCRACKREGRHGNGLCSSGVASGHCCCTGRDGDEGGGKCRT
jgi:hypothetical protein